jgi:flagellar hook-associated protein 3 FlgL
MRISSNLFFQTGLNSINAQQSDLMHLYQQIGSGQRMVSPADDPLGAAQAINISQSQSLNKRFGDNREVAKNNLGIEENTLNSMTTLMQDIKTRLIEAGNGTLSDADRATLANVLQSAKENMLGLANATDGSGQYLFSGHRGNVEPFSVGFDGKVTFKGDEGQRLIQVDQTRQISGSDNGLAVFASAGSGSRAYVTTATGGNLGTGVIGAPTIVDPQGSNLGNTFALSFSTQPIDPLDPTGPQGPLQYSITVTDPDGNQVGPVDGPNDFIEGTTSFDLSGGVRVKFSGQPVAGDNFSIEPVSQSQAGYKTTATNTAVGAAQVNTPVVTDPKGSNIGNTFAIVFSVDPTDPAKLQYTINVTDPAGAAVAPAGVPVPYIPGTTSLDLPGGVQVKLSGNPADGDEFLVEPSVPPASKTDLNIFNTFDDIIAALGSSTNGDPAAQAKLANSLATAMQKMDVNYDQILTIRASIGARMNEIEAIGNSGAARGLSYTKQLSTLEDVDYYSATAQLQLRTSALEAAALAFKKIQATSLFNMGRG